MNPPDLENLLRAAPRPSTPTGLRQRLVRELRSSQASRIHGREVRPSGWLRRFWPTLLLGGAGIAFGAVLWVQQAEIRKLRADLSAPLPEIGVASAARLVATVPANSPAVPAAAVEDKRAEISRLRGEVADLQAMNTTAEQLAAENRRLEAQIAAKSGLTEEDLAALHEGREKMNSIRCVNSLKNIGLALRIWATDHHGTFPSDLLSMTDELSTPKILVCPSDPARKAAKDWVSFTTGNLSYEFLTLGGTETEPTRVAARCPIHGNVLLCDGSVQMSQGDGSNLTRHLVTRDGKLYFE